MENSNPSPTLVRQRIRNRLIEFLEAVSLYDRNSQFDLDELINIWDDWMRRPLVRETMPEPVFSIAEQDELLNVDQAVEQFSAATPQTIIDHASALNTREWKNLVATSRRALEVMGRRGRQSEETEIGT
jgi:hypothetical protein